MSLKVIKDRYYEYNNEIYKAVHTDIITDKTFIFYYASTSSNGVSTIISKNMVTENVNMLPEDFTKEKYPEYFL